MTKSEFLDNITEWWELKDFCSDEDCGICDDVVSGDERDSQIDDDVADEIRNESWHTVNECLNDITTGYEYYQYNGRFDYEGLENEDFERYKSDVLEWGDDNDIWDVEEGEEEDCDIFAEEEDDEPAPEDEDFSVGDLIGMCCVTFATIQAEDVRRAREKDDELRRLYPKVLK